MKNMLLILMLLFATGTCAHGREALTGNDLIFEGAFRLPDEIAGVSFARGLAIRIVNGQPRIFVAGRDPADTTNPPLFEIAPPTLKAAAPWNTWTSNTATVVQNWGKPFADVWAGVRGLYWDEVDDRLYYSSSDSYIAGGVDTDAPTIAYLKLDDANDTTTSHGRWGLSGRSLKMVNNGIIGVPEDFQQAYSVGRLAAGFGGSQSAWTTGPVSPGPALTTFVPPIDGAVENVKLPHIPLVSYGGTGTWDSGEFPAEDRCWRDDNHLSLIYGNSIDPDGTTSRYGSDSTFDSTTDTVSSPLAVFYSNHKVWVYPGVTCPSGLTCDSGFAYWPVNVSGDGHAFQLSLTQNGPPVDFTSAGSGVKVFNFEMFFSGDETLYWQGNSADANVAIDYTEFKPVTVGTKHWVAGNSFWSNDYIQQGGVWIQTENKEGVVVLGNFSTGLVWYFNSQPDAEGQQHQWLIYSPNQFAPVISNTVDEWDIQPSRYTIEFPGVDYTHLPYYGSPYNMSHGMVYDSVNNRLYVSVQFASGDAGNAPVVYVYSVNDTVQPPTGIAKHPWNIGGSAVNWTNN